MFDRLRNCKLTLTLVGVIVLSASLLIWGHLPLQRTYELAFNKVELGDSDFRVRELLGVPHDEGNVRDSRPTIVRIYVYRVSPFLASINPLPGKEWVICFDNSGHVVSKVSDFDGC